MRGRWSSGREGRDDAQRLVDVKRVWVKKDGER
jgi:hypothetical protein